MVLNNWIARCKKEKKTSARKQVFCTINKNDLEYLIDVDVEPTLWNFWRKAREEFVNLG